MSSGQSCLKRWMNNAFDRSSADLLPISIFLKSSTEVKMYYFYNQGHIECPLFGGGLYLQDEMFPVCMCACVCVHASLAS